MYFCSWILCRQKDADTDGSVQHGDRSGWSFRDRIIEEVATKQIGAYRNLVTMKYLKPLRET